MINRKKFFDGYRMNLDPDKKLTQEEVNALTVFLDFVEAEYSKLTVKQWAYVFATTFHETKATFLPIKEAFWLSEAWRLKNLRYAPFYGRGYVQITWEENYKFFSKILGLDLVKSPDLTMIPKNAFKIMIYGFINGSFTKRKVGKIFVPNKISDFINDKETNYKKARLCINGTDKADLIASYAVLFEQLLKV
jgi:hypothetical protein